MDFGSAAFPPSRKRFMFDLGSASQGYFQAVILGLSHSQAPFLGINSISPRVALICARCPQPRQQEINGAWGYSPPLLAAANSCGGVGVPVAFPHYLEISQGRRNPKDN